MAVAQTKADEALASERDRRRPSRGAVRYERRV